MQNYIIWANLPKMRPEFCFFVFSGGMFPVPDLCSFFQTALGSFGQKARFFWKKREKGDAVAKHVAEHKKKFANFAKNLYFCCRYPEYNLFTFKS